MKNLGMTICFAAACIFTAAPGLAAEVASEQSRRYLNAVFDEHVRTADVVFAENINSTTGKKEQLTMRVFEPKGDKAKNARCLCSPRAGALCSTKITGWTRLARSSRAQVTWLPSIAIVCPPT